MTAIQPPEIPQPSQENPPPKKQRHSALRKSMTAADWAEVEAMAGAGLSVARICKAMGFSERTLRRWRKLRPQLEAAVEKGQARTEARVGQKLVEKALAGDVTAIVWYEKTRCGRRETRDVTTGGQPLAPIVYTIQSAAGALLDEVEVEAFEPPSQAHQLTSGTSGSPP